MSWARFDDGYTDHPKILEAGHLAELLDMRAVIYCAHYETDGFVSRSALRRIGRDITRVSQQVERLVGVGRWKAGVDGGWWIHDYLLYNPSKAQKEEERKKARERMAAARDKKGSGEQRANSGRSSDNSRGGRDGSLFVVPETEKCAACKRETPCWCPAYLEANGGGRGRDT